MYTIFHHSSRYGEQCDLILYQFTYCYHLINVPTYNIKIFYKKLSIDI